MIEKTKYVSWQTHTQSLFTGQIGLIQRESSLDQVEHAGSSGKSWEKFPLTLPIAPFVP